MELSEKTIETNYHLFLKKLNELGIDVTALNEKYGEKIKHGTFSNSSEYGLAGDGTFLEIVLKTLTPFAINLNNMFEDVSVDKQTLIKVCLLHQISKCIRLVKNDNQWEIEKRGFMYKYDADQPSLRTGLHSVAMCVECGIDLTAEEIEAMTVNDRDLTDEQARWHSGLMASILRMASELTYLKFKN